VLAGCCVTVFYLLIKDPEKSEIVKGLSIVAFFTLFQALILYQFMADYTHINIDTSAEQLTIRHPLKGRKEVYSFSEIQGCEIEAVSSFRGPTTKSLFLKVPKSRVEISDYWITNLREFESFCFERFLTPEDKLLQIERSKEVDKKERQSLLATIVIWFGVLGYFAYKTPDGNWFIYIGFAVVLPWLVYKYIRLRKGMRRK
jgi:hypothetical protein